MSNEIPKITFVIPAFNEEKNIQNLLEKIRDEIMNSQENVYINVFEDGSTDRTKEILKTLESSNQIPNFKAHMTTQRKGYPKAVKDAIMSLNPNEYPYLLFIDGDGQYYMKDVLKILSCRTHTSQYDMIDGGRKERLDPAWRKLLTGGVRFTESILFRPKIKDITSGLWLMNTEKAQEIASKVKYSQYNFWLEFTARMSVGNYNVMEIPVDHLQREDGDSQVYSINKLPKILWAEIKAVFLTFFELNLGTILKFAFAGGTGAVIILFLTWLFTEYFNIWYLLSAVISIEISILWVFLLNTKITFRYKFKSNVNALKGLVKYHGTALGGMIINLTVLFILTEYLNTYYLLSEFLGIVVAFSFNYLASSRYVWKKDSKTDDYEY